MKKFFNVTAKISIGLIVNLFAVLSTVFNIWEFIKMMIIRIIEKLPDTFVFVLRIISIWGVAACILASDFSIGDKIITIVVIFIGVVLVASLSQFIVDRICEFLVFLVGLLDTSIIISVKSIFASGRFPPLPPLFE